MPYFRPYPHCQSRPLRMDACKLKMYQYSIRCPSPVRVHLSTCFSLPERAKWSKCCALSPKGGRNWSNMWQYRWGLADRLKYDTKMSEEIVEAFKAKMETLKWVQLARYDWKQLKTFLCMKLQIMDENTVCCQVHRLSAGSHSRYWWSLSHMMCTCHLAVMEKGTSSWNAFKYFALRFFFTTPTSKWHWKAKGSFFFD